MTQYLVQPTDRIIVKGNSFLSFAKNMGKNISKNLSSKYSQKPFDHAKQFATGALKTTSKRVIETTAEATCNLIGNKIAGAVPKSYDGKITKVSKNSEAVTNENDKEIPKEIYQVGLKNVPKIDFRITKVKRKL